MVLSAMNVDQRDELRYAATPLNIGALVYTVVMIGFVIVNYEYLGAGFGAPGSALVMIAGFAIPALLVDAALQSFITSRPWLIRAEALALLIWLGLILRYIGPVLVGV
ncbi:MAG: hypothetical protein AAF998_11950 [Bacteroidota bacterium]